VENVAMAGELARVAAERTDRLISDLRALGPDALTAASRLPGWSRLTIVCHLRYGTSALLRMTEDALAGRETAYYPARRATQRPATLAPAAGESPLAVLDDWAVTAARLDELWRSLDSHHWAITVTEPADNRDLGPVPLGWFGLARLTELDVHGVDLDIGFPDWSDVLVDVSLPARLAGLATRRTNHRKVDRSVQGSWLLVADGFRWVISVDGDRVISRPASGPVDQARATISGTRRDLLALLLGRERRQPLEITDDADFAASFERAFPGP
jgi:uncharacterized protein (TIGR03083 family)